MMRYNRLGTSDLMVSECCLGTMTYGEQNTEAQGHGQMDYAIERGINFFDTAELYSIPPRPETQGSTERIIGTWLKARQNRDKIIIATKIVGRSQMIWHRDNTKECRVNEAQINEAIEKSLKRLQTDYIDLYQIHWPDRKIEMFGSFLYQHNEDDFTAFEETLEIFQKHIKKGNIRHIGLSNESPWGTMRFLQEAETRNLPRMISIQNAFHLLNRSYEIGLSEISMRENIGLLAYSPLAQGYLTGKYLNGARPEGARSTLFNRAQRYETPSAEPMIAKYVELAKSRNLDPAQMAIKFCASREFVASTIIGATTMEQLKTNIDAFDIGWDRELETSVNALHQICPNPCP